MKSILSDERKCYICGSTFNVEKHHIFFGNPLRKISDKHGFFVWLCSYHHRDSKEGVHGNRETDLMLKRKCQSVYEEKHSRQDWLKIIKRNYL